MVDQVPLHPRCSILADAILATFISLVHAHQPLSSFLLQRARSPALTQSDESWEATSRRSKLGRMIDPIAAASHNSWVMVFLYNLLLQVLLLGKEALIFIFEDLTIDERLLSEQPQTTLFDLCQPREEPSQQFANPKLQDPKFSQTFKFRRMSLNES